MTSPITPDTVRALIAAAGPEEWRVINGVDDPDPAWGSFPMVATEPSGAPDDEGDEVAIVRNRSNGDAALMAASKRIALAYLDACAERDRLQGDEMDRLIALVRSGVYGPQRQGPVTREQYDAVRERVGHFLNTAKAATDAANLNMGMLEAVHAETRRRLAAALAEADALRAERDRLARVLNDPGDYTQTWKPTYNELVGIAHAQTVTVTVPGVVIRDHLRARLEAALLAACDAAPGGGA